jgi:flavin-dependent dehydrogenase
MYDAIVIGARCAGSPTAMLLAQQGYKVLLVDRASFPSHLPHGHFIHRGGPLQLQKWGLLEQLATAGCPPVTRFKQDTGQSVIAGRDLVVNGVAFGYGPRRDVLDKILVDAAVAAGAESREGFSVQEIIWEGDRVAGIRGRNNNGGGTVTERAQIVIGADGRNSMVARAAQAPAYETVPTLLCWYFSYWSDAPSDDLEFYVRERRIIIAHPTTDQLLAVFVAWPIAEFHQVRADVEASHSRALDVAPELAERVRNGKREKRFLGSGDLPNFFRKPYGPGWALVGDAGHHKDPYLALGVSDAFRDAELLAEAIDDGFSGRQSLDEALAEYERQRNEMAMADYQLNLRMASFSPPPELIQISSALQGNQEDTNRFFMAREGMIPREEFFNPENLQRIMAKAQT